MVRRTRAAVALAVGRGGGRRRRRGVRLRRRRLRRGAHDDRGAGDHGAAGHDGDEPAAPTTASVKVDADPSGQLAFVQKSLTAPAGADIFVLTNDSSVPHNLEIEGKGSRPGRARRCPAARTPS